MGELYLIMDENETITKVNEENLLITRMKKEEQLISKVTLQAQKESHLAEIKKIDGMLAKFN